jgi:cytochrome P450 family 6
LRRESKPKSNINLIDLMIEHNARCEKKEINPKKMSIDDMIGNLSLFFVAGTDTSRSTSTSLLYCLGEHLEARNSIFKDIKDNILDGDIESFIKNPTKSLDMDKAGVLDNFVNETMRLHGININVFRRKCTKNHKLGDIKVRKGTYLIAPTAGLHYDEEYFKNPYKFDIDRFSPERIHEIPKKTFLPFFEGGRRCSG